MVFLGGLKLCLAKSGSQAITFFHEMEVIACF
jgi:hypothetical protein